MPGTAAPITVALGRFDDLFARGLRELIEGDNSLAVVATEVERRRLAVILRAHRPAVAVLDVGTLGALGEVRQLCIEFPGTRLVLFAHSHSREECAQLLAFGASACLRRDTQSRDVLSAIHLASRGLQLAPRAAPDHGGARLADGQLLTRREAEMLPLLQQGRSNAEIALAMRVGVETVRTHARNIYRKLGVSSRRELSATSSPPPAAEHARRRVGELPEPAPGGPVRLRARRLRGHGLHR